MRGSTGNAVNSSWSFVLEPVKLVSVEHNGISHVIGMRHDRADEGISYENDMK